MFITDHLTGCYCLKLFWQKKVFVIESSSKENGQGTYDNIVVVAAHELCSFREFPPAT